MCSRCIGISIVASISVNLLLAMAPLRCLGLLSRLLSTSWLNGHKCFCVLSFSLVMMSYDLITARSAGFHPVYPGDPRRTDHITSFLAGDNDTLAVALPPDKYINYLEK